MLASIPPRILAHEITVNKVVSADAWGKATTSPQAIRRVYVEKTNRTSRSRDNVERKLAAVIYADARISTPFPWEDEKEAAENAGSPLSLVYGGRTYSVFDVITVCDDCGNIHHYEIEVI